MPVESAPDQPKTSYDMTSLSHMATGLSAEITPLAFFKVLERWYANLTLWHADDMRMPTAGEYISLPHLNPRYRAIDRACCIEVTPINALHYFSGDRIQAAQVLVEEVLKRGWTRLEVTGNTEMQKAAFVACTLIARFTNKPIELMNYMPTERDRWIVEQAAKDPRWHRQGPAPSQSMETKAN